MLPLKVINLWAGPAAGKSTTAAGLFNLMKNLGLRVELVSEYAKDLTYEDRASSLGNQLYVLGKQDQRLRRLVGQVDWAITDSPLPLCLAYMTPEYEDFLPEAIVGAYNRYDNYDFFVQRVKPYQQYGRSQTEHQALALDINIRDLFKDCAGSPGDFQTWEIIGDVGAPWGIVEKLGLISKESVPVGVYNGG